MKLSMAAAYAAFLGCAAISAHAADEAAAAAHCSLATLNGTMAWSENTFSTTGAASSSGSGQESYDGKGHMKYFEFYSDGVTSTTYTGTGTYTISANCVATVTYDSQTVPWVYFVSQDGDHYYWNNNQGQGFLSAGRADRISRALLVK